MELTYDNIQREAEAFAQHYRKRHHLPALPAAHDVQRYRDLLYSKFGLVVDLIKRRLSQVDSEGGHGFDHLEDVATRAGYIAENECRRLKITGKSMVIERAVLAGVLHDVERHLGFEDNHMIEGEKTTRRILHQAGFMDDTVATVVRNHDYTDFDPGEDKILSIVFGSVFDADHFRYGLEREDTFWRMKEKRGKSAADVIHDYQWLYLYRNAWRTEYGKSVGPEFIDFGIAIAKHIEEIFSSASSP